MIMTRIHLYIFLSLAIAMSACARENATVVSPTAPTRALATTMPTPLLNASSSDKLLVKISDGALQGTRENNVSMFKGIPYAAPPVGELRWREPQPAASWQGTRAADAFGKACIQPGGNAAANGTMSVGPQSEDCLYLNVWTPDADPNAKLPVMVWIHGGALVLGAGSLPIYDGSALAERGAVVVTINYRLGPLGFFSHPALDKESPNGPVNFGLLDEIAALKWVQKNISAFGGDPNNVTIFGESAGAQSVLALFASPLARGLFQRGVAESSYGIPSHARAQAQQVGIQVANAVGVNGADASMQALRAVPAEKFGALQGKETSLAPSFVIGDAALPETILDAFQKGNQAPVPLIIGNNSNEASVAEAFGIDLAKLIEKLGVAKIALKPLYPGVTDDADLGRQVMRDLLFTAFAKRIADAHSARAPVWRYYFTYVMEKMRASQPGVAHGGEIAYVFDSLDKVPAYAGNVTDADRAMADRVSAYWFTFARDNKPEPQGEPVWVQSTPKQDTVMEFGETIAPQTDFMKKRLDVFVDLLKLLGKILTRE